MKEPMVITMAREYASGGSEIAQAVADKLGIPLYNKELITLAAKKSGLTEEAIAASENQRSGSLIQFAKSRPDAKDMPDRLWETQLAKHDRARASYYNYYTENRWGEAKNYDLCLNATLGREACADLIVAAARAMQEADK